MTGSIKVSYSRPDNWINIYWLKVARESRGLSMEEFAKRTGMSFKYLTEMERGEIYPDDKQLSCICASLNYPKEFFLQEKNPPATAYNNFNRNK